MGRWAYFSSGIQYKFAFAVQSSGDILEFGGKITKLFYVNKEDHYEMIKKINHNGFYDEILELIEEEDVAFEFKQNEYPALEEFATEHTDNGDVNWTDQDIPNIEIKLQELFKEINKLFPNFMQLEIKKYELNEEGTKKLLDDYYNQIEKIENENVYKFILGSIINHQLLYERDLECNFEW